MFAPLPWRTLRLSIRLVLACFVLGPDPLPARTIVAAGRPTEWKYHDADAAPDAAWRDVEYDDSAWRSGQAPLGYGETTIATRVNSGPDDAHRPMTAWFRSTFAEPELKPGERLVISCCVDDGAVIYLNGQEVGRINMPAGPVDAATPAARTIGNDSEGFYSRMHVPAESLRLGAKNVLAVEVHQAAPTSSDLYFDLALKVLPAIQQEATAAPAARTVIDVYNQRHYVGPEVAIPNGYIDGGRGMKIDATGSAASGREILVVDRPHDKELADDLAFARSDELKSLPTLQRVQRLAARIDQRTTPPGGLRWVEDTVGQLEDEFANKPVLIGDWVDQCQAGVCRHRALLFKLLADEAGLKAALVRGNYASDGPPGFPHAWNEVTLDDGQRVLVDVMHNGGQPKFPPLTDPKVIQRYRKVDGAPWYGTRGE